MVSGWEMVTKNVVTEFWNHGARIVGIIPMTGLICSVARHFYPDEKNSFIPGNQLITRGAKKANVFSVLQGGPSYVGEHNPQDF